MDDLHAFQSITRLIVVGDAHGKIELLNTLAKRNLETLHIQIGDLGLGFVNTKFLRCNIRYFVGNHDNRSLSPQEPFCLGDWGTITTANKKILFISGGYSIDAAWRTPGISWWADEELPTSTLQLILDNFRRMEPDIVLSHEAPMSLIPYVGLPGLNIPPSRTALALEAMFQRYQPPLWIFGHYHKKWESSDRLSRTRFVCLNELESMALDV